MKTVFCSIFLVTATCSFSQQEVFKFHPSYSNFIRGNFIVDENANGYYIVASDKDYIDRFYQSASGKTAGLLHQSSDNDPRFVISKDVNEATKKLYLNNRYVGGAVIGGIMIDVIQHKSADDLIFVETNLSMGTSVVTDTVKVNRREDVVMTFKRNNRICVIEKPKSKRFFLFHSKAPGASVQTDTLHATLPSMGRDSNHPFSASIDDLSDVTINDDIEVVPNNIWIPVQALGNRNKAFVQKDKFIVTINANDLSTWVLSIDLNTLQYTLAHYADYEKETLKGSSSNTSLIIDTLLITAVANDKSIYYSVYNLNTEGLLYTQRITDEDIAASTMGHVQKVGDFWSRSNLSDITLKELVSKAINNQLILTGYREDNNLFLTFGSKYVRLVTATFIGNVITAGAGGFMQVKPPSTAYFHLALQLPNYSASSREIRNVVWDKMTQFIWSNKISADNISLFNMNGFFYIGHFNKDKSLYVINRFNEKSD